MQSTDISYQGVIDCADFIRDNLVPHGYHDLQGRVVMSLDAWWNDNLSDSQIRQFVSYCRENNMIPGLYYGPFCRFGDLQSTVPGTSNRYRFRDLALKVGGRYKVIDGAYCLDPTHPGTKMFMLSEVNKFKQWGIEYLKCDFQSNGAIEADRWYADTCYTGLQAYNIGMAYLLKRTGDTFLNMEQFGKGQVYVNGHAIGRFWSIGPQQTLSQVYVANDPDHMVMCMRQEAGGIQPEGANRARITSGAIVGAFLTGDNFSPNVTLHDDGQTRPNYYATSQARALDLLTNEDVNEIPRTCRSFRPVYGNASANGTQAEHLMTYETDRYVYLAVLNYQMVMPQTAEIPFADLGLEAQNVGAIKELWMQEAIAPTATGLRYNVPGYDARIYRIEKRTPTPEAIHTPQRQPSSAVSYYSLSGRPLNAPQNNAVNLVREADGTVRKLLF